MCFNPLKESSFKGWRTLYFSSWNNNYRITQIVAFHKLIFFSLISAEYCTESRRKSEKKNHFYEHCSIRVVMWWGKLYRIFGHYPENQTVKRFFTSEIKILIPRSESFLLNKRKVFFWQPIFSNFVHECNANCYTDEYTNTKLTIIQYILRNEFIFMVPSLSLLQWK